MVWLDFCCDGVVDNPTELTWGFKQFGIDSSADFHFLSGFDIGDDLFAVFDGAALDDIEPAFCFEAFVPYRVKKDTTLLIFDHLLGIGRIGVFWWMVDNDGLMVPGWDCRL